MDILKYNKANEYKFLSGNSSGNTITFSGITSEGVSTILNTILIGLILVALLEQRGWDWILDRMICYEKG